MSSYKSIIAYSILLVLLMTISPFAVLTAHADTYPEQVSGNVIKIGMTISLTGKYATEGKQALCGIKAAIAWLNDKGGITVGGTTYKFQLIYYDDQSSSDLVSTLYNKLINEDQVNFLLAPYSSGLTSAAAPIAEQYKVLMLSHGGASDKIFEQGYQYLVQVLSPASMYLVSALDLIKKYIPDAKIAFIYENKPFAKAVIEGARKHAEELGLNVVYVNAYEAGTTDFSTYIQAAMDKGADVLLGGGHYEDGKALVKQAHDLGWKLKFIAILVAPAQPKFYDELKADVAEGVAFPAQWAQQAEYSPDVASSLGLEWYGPTKDEWLQYFNQICPELEAPAYQAAEAGAAVIVLAKAIEVAGSLDSTAVRQALNNLDLLTFFGRFKIDPQTGKQMGHQMVIMQWQNGKREIIFPESVATADPIIGPPNWWPEGPIYPTTATQPSPTTETTSSPESSPSGTTSVETTTPEKGVGTGTIAAIIVIIIIIVAAVALLRRK
ncbi:MAG: amino acid ABC transporter substrate-binding protein [Desulfurococcales archaeon]|nr:amino acid ABC transporter substrate-binding protein [Desulfurococcales archaeon]